MKKLIFSLIILMLLLLAWQAQAEEAVIFEKSDPVGDEYGPGTYVYPTSEQFSPYEGLFDLTEFKVTEGKDNYNFYFKFVEINNPWHAKYGFSHQLIQVYIDNKQGGSRKTFKPGANVKFEEQHPWNKLIKITGWSLELYSAGDKADKDGRLGEGEVELDGKTIRVSIPKDKLGDLAEAYYYVLIGSLDGFGYDNYREVVEEAEGWKFGGGTNTNLNPNVVDTLVPEGLDQRKILASYDLEEGELATLRAVGPELSLPFKFIIIFGFLAVSIFSLLGVGIKFIRDKMER